MAGDLLPLNVLARQAHPTFLPDGCPADRRGIGDAFLRPAAIGGQAGKTPIPPPGRSIWAVSGSFKSDLPLCV